MIGGGIFTLGRAGAGPPGPGAGNPATAACIAATICASSAAPAGGGPGGPGRGVVPVLLLDHLQVELVRPSQIPNAAID